MGSWFGRRGKVSPKKEEKLSLKTRKKFLKISIFYAVIF
jgi:hypothetical protein